MAKIEDFFKMTAEQRLDFYDKIKDNNKLEDDDLKGILEKISIEQYNQLNAEVVDNDSYLKIFEANMDFNKLTDFKKENDETKNRMIEKIAPANLLEQIKRAQTADLNIKTIERISKEKDDLKEKLLKDSRNSRSFIDTDDILNKYTSPLKESINDKSLNDSVAMKIKLISLEHNTHLYNNYSNHATSLLNTLEKTMASQQKLTRTDFSNLKAHFFSDKNEEKISLKDYIKMGKEEEEGNKVKDIFSNLEKGKNVNNNLNELKTFLTIKKDGLIETTNSLKDYNEDIKKSLAKNNITPEFMMKMWKQGKDGKWIQEEIDLFKELNLKDEKALQQRIEEIQSANKLHMNTNTTGITAASIQQAMDKTFNGNTVDGRSNGLGFFNYTVFPYTLMIDLGAAGLNFYSFGKNIAQDIKDKKEKNEILKAVSDELSTFDINNLVDTTTNKELLNDLTKKAKDNGTELEEEIKNHYKKELKQDLEANNLKEEVVNQEIELLTKRLMAFKDYQGYHHFINLDLNEQNKTLNAFKEGLDKLKDENYDLSKLDEEMISLNYTKSFISLLNEDSEKYEKIEQIYKNKLEEMNQKIEEIKSDDPSLIMNNNKENIEYLSQESLKIKNNLKIIEENKLLFKDIQDRQYILEDREKDIEVKKIISEEVGKENFDNVFSQKAEVLAKIHNEESFKNKATELNKNSLIGINNINKVTNGLTKEYLNEENVQKFDEAAKNISKSTGQEVSGLDVATTFLANKGKENPLFKHVSQQVNDSLTSFKNEMKASGREPTLKEFIGIYGIMDPIDIDSIFKEQFEAFLTNYDEMQKAAKELGLENSMLFKAGQSKEIGAFREKILGFDKALSENLEKSDYSHIVPKKFQDLITDAKEGEKFLEMVKEKGDEAFNNLQINQQLNQQQKDNLNKIDDTIEKNRKIELEKKEKELQDKKLKEDRDKKESEGMSFGGR